MSRVRLACLWQGSLLLLAGLASAEAQYPAPRNPSRSTTSAVGQLPLHDSAFAPPKTGTLRLLVCRGGEGLQVQVQQDPSPRHASQVAVSLAYRRNSKPVGSAYENLEPGVCSWNLTGSAAIPAEPGVVHFDLNRQGHEYTPDPTTLPIYLGNPRHFWVFYVDDVTHVSGSHGAYGGRFRADSALTPPRKPSATALRRERLRCRGGSGLAFNRGEREAPNLFGMTLRYQVAATAAGPVGKGLQPGTCAWADRADARAEPGRVRFTTAGNAQAKARADGIHACELLSNADVEKVTGRPSRKPSDPHSNVQMTYSACSFRDARVWIALSANASQALKHVEQELVVGGFDQAKHGVTGVGDSATIYFKPKGKAPAGLMVTYAGTRAVTIRVKVDEGQPSESAQPLAVGLAKIALAKLN